MLTINNISTLIQIIINVTKTTKIGLVKKKVLSSPKIYLLKIV